MKTVGGENLSGIREELDLFARIRGTIAEIDILAGARVGLEFAFYAAWLMGSWCNCISCSDRSATMA